MKSSITLTSARSVAAEISSIVVGVLLALALNEWNENRIHAIRADEAILSVIHEINSNIKLLNVVNKNNQSIVDMLQSKKNNPENNDERQFIPGLQIQDTAWKTLLSTGISEFISYSKLHEISAIYALQDIYKSLSYQLVQTMLSSRVLAASIAPDRTIITNDDLFLDHMILIVKVEKALLSSYKNTLKHLKPIKLVTM